MEPEGDAERVLLLPEDPDASATGLRTALRERTGTDVTVIINDSTGRAWRNGTSGMALGASGLPVLQDLRGQRDLYGRPLQATQVGLGDELAAAASLLQGEAAEGRPVVRVRGLGAGTDGGAASALIRAKDEDLFR